MMGSGFSFSEEDKRNTSIIITTSPITGVPLSSNDIIEFDISNSSNSYDLSRQSASLNINNSFPISGTKETYDDFNFNLLGTDVYPFKWITMATLNYWLGLLMSTAMIIGCVMPYVPQYITIYKNHNCIGFSTFVCLTLLLANILRVAFWFGNHFELPLLIQSLIMIPTQILLLELCVRVKRQNNGTMNKNINLFSSNHKHFWRWTYLTSYIEFLSLFIILIGIAMYLLIDYKPFVEAIGYCALVTESLLGLPQVINNYKNRSVIGMSISMVLMWLAGDSFKTGYFIWYKTPFQFWLCGLLQITIDLLILFQVCLYRQNAPIKMSSRADNSSKEMMAL